jgi:hypothetical protein
MSTISDLLIEINGTAVEARFTVEIDQIKVTSLGATKPDMTWGEYDPAGHFHAWSFDQVRAHTLPTLKEFRRLVHGCPEDYYETFWRCRLCRATVTPRRVPDGGPKFVPGTEHWGVLVLGPYPAPVPDDVSVRVPLVGGRILFGIARPVNINAGPHGTDVELVGVGPLGRSGVTD